MIFFNGNDPYRIRYMKSLFSNCFLIFAQVIGYTGIHPSSVRFQYESANDFFLDPCFKFHFLHVRNLFDLIDNGGFYIFTNGCGSG